MLTGSIEIVETLDIKSLEEHDDLNVRPESIGNEPGIICEGCEKKGPYALLEMVSTLLFLDVCIFLYPSFIISVIYND